MKLTSFARLCGERWFRRKSKARGRKEPETRKRARLWVETLESRVLLNNDTPRIISVLPVDGSVLPIGQAHPLLQITFSEDMVKSEAESVANYKLEGDKGNVVTIDRATYVSNPLTNTFTVTLAYNGGADLIADYL